MTQEVDDMIGDVINPDKNELAFQLQRDKYI